MLKLNAKIWYYLESYKLAKYQEKKFLKYLSLNLNGVYLLTQLVKDHDELDKWVEYILHTIDLVFVNLWRSQLVKLMICLL